MRKDGAASDSEAAGASPRRGLLGKVRRFFGTRLIVAVIAVGAGTAATVTLLAGLNRMVPLDSNPLLSVAALVATLGSAHVAYVLYVRWFEKRSAEGSVFVPLIAGALAVWLLRRAAAKGHLVPGPWNRSEPVPPGGPTLAASAAGAVDPRRHAPGG